MLVPWPLAADQLTTADWFARVAVTDADAVGTMPITVELLEIGDEVPTALVAVTENVYDVPLVRPVTMQVVATVVVHVNEPGVEVTV